MTTLSIPEHSHKRARRNHTWHKTVLRVIKGGALSVFAPHKASLSKLADTPLTVAGAGCVAAGVFLASTIAGLVILGVVLVLLEHMIADSG